MTSKQNSSFVDTVMVNAPLDEAVEWINNNLDPKDVFDEAKLEAWAENNGYKKE
jgi:hypothetical protein